MHLSPPPPGGLGCCPFESGCSAVVESLFIVILIWESVIILCFVVCYFMFILVFNHLNREERAGCFA